MTVTYLPANSPPGISALLTITVPFPASLAEVEMAYLRVVLSSVGNRKRAAAEILKINCATLYRKLHPRSQSA